MTDKGPFAPGVKGAIISRRPGEKMWNVEFYEGHRRLNTACTYTRWGARLVARRWALRGVGDFREEVRP